MTASRVDFYVLENASADTHDRLICRVIEKAWQQGHTVYVQCADRDAARAFDGLLWRFQDVSFVPHGLEDDPALDAPVVIGLAAPDAGADTVLVNLSAAIPATSASYARIAESAGYDEATRQAARARYRLYQARGCTLTTHKLVT